MKHWKGFVRSYLFMLALPLWQKQRSDQNTAHAQRPRPQLKMHLSTFLSTTLLAGLVAGHPGHDHAKELKARLEFLANNKNDLSHCAEQLRARGHDASNVRRRMELAENLLKKRGLEGELHTFETLSATQNLYLVSVFPQCVTFRRSRTATSLRLATRRRRTLQPCLPGTAHAF